MAHRNLISRRAWLAGGGVLALGLGARAAASEPSHRVSAAQLQRVLQERFPRRFPVRGLVDIDLQVPRLRFLPEQNRLGTEVPIQVSGPALRRGHAGSVDLDFALRYEASDQSIRAHQIRVNAVRIDGLGRDAANLLEAYVGNFSQQALGEVVLHQLRPQDLALAHTMGLEPGAITVTQQGLVIALVPQK
jgi:hypothetical protein